MNDLNILRAFVVVAREGSVSRAAERLHLTQPAVSIKIKQLQENLQLKLFLRRPQGLALTEDGRALLPAAEKALSSMGVFNQSARALNRTLRGQLKLGTIIDPEFIRLGAFLHQLVDQAPQIETQLQHGMSGTVLGQVHRGELDVGFYLSAPGIGTGEASPFVAHRELTVFDYHIIAPPTWGDWLQETDWASLASLPWIVTPPSSVHNRLLHGVLDPLGLAPRRVAQVDQEACMLNLVRAGVGLSLARDAVAMTERQERGLVVAKDVRLPCALSFIWRRDRSDEQLIAEALDVLSRVWGTQPTAMTS
jgi:DNA-binding transcriptional LysR family regulator